MQVDVFRVQSVTVKRDETRGNPNCADYDRYRLTIKWTTLAAEHLAELEVGLYAAPGADIGLGPLVGEALAEVLRAAEVLAHHAAGDDGTDLALADYRAARRHYDGEASGD